MKRKFIQCAFLVSLIHFCDCGEPQASSFEDQPASVARVCSYSKIPNNLQDFDIFQRSVFTSLKLLDGKVPDECPPWVDPLFTHLDSVFGSDPSDSLKDMHERTGLVGVVSFVNITLNSYRVPLSLRGKFS